MLEIRIALIILGVLGLADTAFVSTISNSNLGVLLPGILGLPLLLWGLFFPALGRVMPAGWFAALKWLLIAGYCLALLLFAVTWVVIDRAASRTVPKDLDAVIVLGAGLRGEKLMRVLRQRVDAAILYLEDNPNTVIILSGGKGSDEIISEAEAMARYLAQRGVSEERYIKEDQSRNTRENFRYSYDIIKRQLGSNARIGFITTDFHLFRAGRVAAKQGITAQGIAAPGIWYISLNNHLRECVAVWAYALTGNL